MLLCKGKQGWDLIEPAADMGGGFLGLEKMLQKAHIFDIFKMKKLIELTNSTELDFILSKAHLRRTQAGPGRTV